MLESSDQERIEALEAEAVLQDERIAGLITDLDNLMAKAAQAAVVNQAKGIIMSAAHCGPDAALAVLVAHSHGQNRELWEVASELAAAQDQPELAVYSRFERIAGVAG